MRRRWQLDTVILLLIQVEEGGTSLVEEEVDK